MLISPEENAKKIQVRIRLSENILQEIHQYCEYSGIKHRDYFIEKACQYIFNHDPDWKKIKSKNLD